MKQFLKKFCIILLIGVLSISALLCGCEKQSSIERVDDTRNLNAYEYTQLNITAKDEYGRKITSADSKKKDKYVGMFFYLTNGSHRGTMHNGIYDVTKILRDYGRQGFDRDWNVSPVGQSHFWGEPVWGYYDSSDPWVIRKQVEMLTMIGIDFLMFDATNAVLYEHVHDVLLPVMAEYRNQGWNVPQAMWLLNASKDAKVQEENLTALYKRYYLNEDLAGLWFAPNGKPLAAISESAQITIGSESTENQKMLNNYFEFRSTVWPNDAGIDLNAFPWIDWKYPQVIYGDAINVSVAQHVTSQFSDTVGSKGHGWNWETYENEEDFTYGANFQSQWKTALDNQDKVKYVIVTQWNEWTAIKKYFSNMYVCCDSFNDEFNRDIEPSRTSNLKDKRYIQTGIGVKQFSYNTAVHYNYPSITLSLNDYAEDKWMDATTFKDFVGECISRNYLNFDASGNIEDYSNRNDIADVKVTRDSNYMYFRVTTKEDITKPDLSDKKWMNIWIRNSSSSPENGIGFQYVINKNLLTDGTAEIIKYDKNGKEVSAGTSEYSVDGNVMIVKVPLKAIGLSKTNYDIEFKVTDNVKNDKDILDFYCTGDSAPIGSMCYQYGY